nr:hypothetical protein [uncultured Flavobacterium sp.]
MPSALAGGKGKNIKLALAALVALAEKDVILAKAISYYSLFYSSS